MTPSMTETRETALPRVTTILFWTFTTLGVTLNTLIILPGVVMGVAQEAWLPVVFSVGMSVFFWTMVYGVYWSISTYVKWKAGRDVGEDLTIADL